MWALSGTWMSICFGAGRSITSALPGDGLRSQLVEPVDCRKIFFTPEEWEELVPAVKPLLSQPTLTLKTAYELLGGAFSYGRLRMVLAFLKRRDGG